MWDKQDMEFIGLRNELISLYMELEGCSCEETIDYINKNFKTLEDLKEEIEWVCEILSK